MGVYQLKGLKHGAFSILNVPTNLYSRKQNTNPMKVPNLIVPRSKETVNIKLVNCP